MKTFFKYVKESIGEIKFIKWPTKEETLWYTVAVIVISFVVAYYLGFFDVIFAKILKLAI
jgi:preprotein translocase SecE subunit